MQHVEHASSRDQPHVRLARSAVRALLVFGTRPEVIKLAPLYQELLRRREHVETRVCFTGQHEALADEAIDYFGIGVDQRLDLMRHGQSLAELSARGIAALNEVIEQQQPDCVVVQGDTTSVLCAAYAAFLQKCAVVHVEAGLRTGDLCAPWPEEMNRRVTSVLASLHCAPTAGARENLLREGVRDAAVHVTGNTIVDALLWTRERERARDAVHAKRHAYLGDRRMVLVTCHRRENFGAGVERICEAVAKLARSSDEVAVVFPVHANPNIRQVVERALAGEDRIYLPPAVGYPEFVWLMDRSTAILTDSGGVQEEAISLGKPVLVMRDVTERTEGLDLGAAELVGTDTQRIYERTQAVLNASAHGQSPRWTQNPYGDGQASRRIADLIVERRFERLANHPR